MKSFVPTNKYVDEEYFEDTSCMDSLPDIKTDNIYLYVYFGVVRKSKIRKISDPYFKIYRYDEKTDKFIDLCRISMIKPEYITDMNESMELSNNELDAFCDMLNDKNYNSALCNNYSTAINDINRNMEGCHYLWWRKLSDKYIPNYKLLKSKERSK